MQTLTMVALEMHVTTAGLGRWRQEAYCGQHGLQRIMWAHQEIVSAHVCYATLACGHSGRYVISDRNQQEIRQA